MRTILIVLSLTFTTSLFAQNQEAMRLYSEGRKAESQQDWNKAESLYGKAIEEDPENAQYYHARGKLNMLLARDSKAKEDINKAIELAPENPKMHMLKAQYFVYNELPDSAMLYIQNAEDLKMSDHLAAKAKIARGDVYRLKQDYEKAVQNYEEGLAVDTANVEGLENMALVLYELGDQKQAAHYLQQLLKVNPYIMDTYINVGFIYAKIGMFLESLSYSEEALKYDPQQPIALANKAYALYRMESFEEAQNAVDKSLQNNPANPFALKTRALLTIATDGKIKKACKDLKKAKKFGYNELFDDGEVDELLEKHCQ